MKLFINGNEETITGTSVSINDLLKYKKVKMPDMVSVELNDRFLNRDDFEVTILKEGDKVEFLYFMGGGSVNRVEVQSYFDKGGL